MDVTPSFGTIYHEVPLVSKRFRRWLLFRFLVRDNGHYFLGDDLPMLPGGRAVNRNGTVPR